MRLTTISWEHIHCGCQEDPGYGIKACPTMALAQTLRDAAELVRLRPNDPKSHEFLNSVLERMEKMEADGATVRT